MLVVPDYALELWWIGGSGWKHFVIPKQEECLVKQVLLGE